MEKNKPFPLSHVALYAKNWYQTTADIWSDLIKMLELDGYTPGNKEDAFRIIVNRYSESIFNGDLYQLFDQISANQCYLVGYIHKNSQFNTEGKYNNEYDYKEAIIRKILSDVRFTDATKLIIKKPVYSELNPMPSHTTKKEINKMFSSY